jgi:predicted TIM-barrel fold metal-dependent hydrolase
MSTDANSVAIVDAHHHIWRQSDLPWLQGPMVPRIFGPYEPIRRDYPIEEYLADIRGSGVESSVYVQTNWAKERAVEEVEWVQATAEAHGWPSAIVGYADLLADDADTVLRRQSRCALLRGVRMQLHWHDNPMYRFAAGPDLAADPRLQRNLRALAAHGLSFDLQVFSGQMKGAAALARINPEITFVLQHAGMLEDSSDAGVGAWREGVKRLADEPNVVSKLSGLGTFIHRNDPSHIAFIVRETVELFGPERCLFGSNFPIEKLWTSYGELVDAYRTALSELSAKAQRLILGDTARRVYRL